MSDARLAADQGRESEKSVALIGMMGAGKTTVGNTLAAKLHREFKDSDAIVEAESGMTVAEIFRTHGEDAFRNWEERALTGAIYDESRPVIGVAGGAVLRESSRKLLKDNCTVVWLEAPIEVLIGRVINRHLDRPLIADMPEETMRNLYRDREPIYKDMAHITVSSEGRTPDAIADDIIAQTQMIKGLK